MLEPAVYVSSNCHVEEIENSIDNRYHKYCLTTNTEKRMRIFDFFNKKMTIDFSVDNIKNLTRISDDLGKVLLKADFKSHIDYLARIIHSAERHDTKSFIFLVLSADVFGGSGALWEIGFEDKELQTNYEKQFCNYIDLLKRMGIKSGRVNRVRKLLSHDNYNKTKT